MERKKKLRLKTDSRKKSEEGYRKCSFETCAMFSIVPPFKKKNVNLASGRPLRLGTVTTLTLLLCLVGDFSPIMVILTESPTVRL